MFLLPPHFALQTLRVIYTRERTDVRRHANRAAGENSGLTPALSIVRNRRKGTRARRRRGCRG